jgi:hypothetical protein
MKNILTLSLVLGAAALAGGCIITSNNNNGGNTGTVTATWDLQDWNDAGKAPIAANCPAGADTAIVYSLAAGDTNTADAVKDLFTCSDFGGTTAPILNGNYTEWVEITDHSGATLYAQSNSQTAGVRIGGDTALTFPFQVNRGYAAAAWTLQGASTHATITCTQAVASGVELNNMVGSNIPIADQFTCTDGQGTTYPLPIANYSMTVAAIDNSNPPKELGAATQAGAVNVQYGNQLINQGSFVLSIDGK